jgi:hypothetical protein
LWTENLSEIDHGESRDSYGSNGILGADDDWMQNGVHYDDDPPEDTQDSEEDKYGAY